MGIGQQVAQRPVTVSLRYHEELLSSKKVDEIQKLEVERTKGAPVLVTAWYQKGTSNISSSDGRQTKVQSVLVNGSSKRLFDGELLSGNWLDEADRSGCMISADTAYKLYGSTNTDGLEVKIDDETYQIMGVLRGAKEAVVLNNTEKNAKDEKIFSNITLEITDGKNSEIAVQEFSARHGMPQAPITVSSSFQLGIAEILAAIGGSIMAIVIVAKIIRNLWSVRMNNIELLIWSVIFIAVVGILVWSVGNRFSFPENLIPSKWSDFEFWSKTFKNLFTEASQFMKMEKYKPDEYIWNLIIQQILFTVALTITTGLAVWAETKTRDTNLFIKELLCIGLAFSVVAISVSTKIPLETSRGYWVLFPLMLALPQ